MTRQLDRLVTFAALPNVRLGIIGFQTPYVVAPAHGFWLLDSDLVMVETFSAELRLAQPEEIELYGGIFDKMAAVASYGRAARARRTRSFRRGSDQGLSRNPENQRPAQVPLAGSG